jgi:lantibiotic modifying enzyme
MASTPRMDRLAALAAQAAPLSLRLATAAGTAPNPAAQRRLERWSAQVARGDADRFAARLALDGIAPETAASALSDAVPGTAPLPEWALLVDEGLSHMADTDLDADRSLPGPDEPEIPLQQLHVAFVRAARARLDASGAAIGPDVLPVLERELLTRLGALASPTLERELRRARRDWLDPLEEALLRANEEPPRERYLAWAQAQRDGGYADVLDAHPVLARLLGSVTLDWVAGTALLLAHLGEDAAVLAATFGAEGPLVAVGGASSDPHRGGRRVVGCTFASGTRVVYKPKDLRTEQVYADLLHWLNAHGAQPALRPLTVLDCGDHGWVEYAEHAPVAEPEEVDAFYHRAGQQLALLYALGANDCHAENLIAAGADPVIVDAETILHPTLHPIDAVAEATPDALHLAADQRNGSVLGVGLLPDWMVGTDGRALDISGLGGVEPQETLITRPRWQHPNTDVARIVAQRGHYQPGGNVLRLGEVVQRPEEHLDALAAGFAAAYATLLAHRDELLTPAGELEPLCDAPVRVLLRATQIYARVGALALQPEHLRSGADFSIALELLGRPLLDSPQPERIWEVHRREQAQMEADDIPYFAVVGGSEALLDEDGRPLLRFRASALEAAHTRLRSLSAEDERLQLAILRAALATRATPTAAEPLPDGAEAADGAGPKGPLAGGPAADGAGPKGPLPGGAAADGAAPEGPLLGSALDGALLLAADLEATAIRSDSSAAWVGLALGDEAERWTLRPTGSELYEGAPGIAVALAALARVTGDDRWAELSRAALAATLEQAERDPVRLAVLRGIGGAGGCGGMLYALALVTELLDDERPLAAARGLAAALPHDALRADRSLDLLGGAAGAIAGLLAVDRVAGGDADAVAAARVAAATLAGAARDSDGGPMWPTLGGMTLDGFSHGTAGIALQVARIGARTQDEALLDLAANAIAGESDRYDSTLGGWPDRRDRPDRVAPEVTPNWCHGAAGIVLSRLELARTPLGERIPDVLERDLARATIALRDWQPRMEQLCCGAAGGIDALVELGARRDDAAATRAAQERADTIAGHLLAGRPARLNRPDRGAAEVPAPGLYQGTAGLGLALLRSRAPELPSVLSWR